MREKGPEQRNFDFEEGNEKKSELDKGSYTTPSGERVEWEDIPGGGRKIRRFDKDGEPIENKPEKPWEDLGSRDKEAA
jgi:hypothetical protein